MPTSPIKPPQSPRKSPKMSTDSQSLGNDQHLERKPTEPRAGEGCRPVLQPQTDVIVMAVLSLPVVPITPLFQGWCSL